MYHYFTALISSIHKENVLPNAMIRDIMVANPHSAKSETILDEIDTRAVSMPEYMMNQILEGQTFTGAQENLTAIQAYYTTNSFKSWSNLFRIFNNDTASVWPVDSLYSLLSVSNKLDTKYKLAFMKLFHGDSLNANQLLSWIPGAFSLNPDQLTEYTNFQSICTILTDLLDSDSTLEFPDSVQHATLTSIMNSSHDISGVYARNLLLQYDFIEFDEPILITPTLKSRWCYNAGVSQQPGSEKLILYPNPALDYVIAGIHISEDLQQATLIIKDAAGHIIRIIPVQHADDQLIIPLQGLSPGVYSFLLSNNGIISQSRLMVTGTK